MIAFHACSHFLNGPGEDNGCFTNYCQALANDLLKLTPLYHTSKVALLTGYKMRYVVEKTATSACTRPSHSPKSISRRGSRVCICKPRAEAMGAAVSRARPCGLQ